MNCYSAFLTLFYAYTAIKPKTKLNAYTFMIINTSVIIFINIQLPAHANAMHDTPAADD